MWWRAKQLQEAHLKNLLKSPHEYPHRKVVRETGRARHLVPGVVPPTTRWWCGSSWDSDSNEGNDVDDMDEDPEEEEQEDPSDGQVWQTYKATTEGGKAMARMLRKFC